MYIWTNRHRETGVENKISERKRHGIQGDWHEEISYHTMFKDQGIEIGEWKIKQHA